MTDSFGARLRHARERRQVSLADIAARTKIKASLFESIERDDASHWPLGIFRRSFMRAYAEAVGLDADATVREFLERFPDPSDPRPLTPAVSPPPDHPVPTRPTPLPTASTAAAPAGAGPRPGTLRLTLVETGLPFTGGRVLADARRRASAAAWDLGSLLAIALSAFVILDAFWMPFAVTALCYYVGGVLLLGNSPGVCLFAPRALQHPSGSGPAGRRSRPRQPEHAHVRQPEPIFRARRWQREVRA